MKNLENKQELARMVELYKTGKITRHSLESELSKAFSAALEPLVVSISLVTEQDGSTNSTFGVATLPQRVGDKIDSTVLVDQEMIIGLVRPEEVVSIIENELKGLQDTLKKFNSFVNDNKGSEVPISKSMAMFVSLFAASIKRFSEGMPELFSRLRDSRTIQSVESIEAEAEAIGSESDELRHAVERLTISKKFPQLFVAAANNLAKELSGGVDKGAKIPLFYTDEAPVMNQFYQQRRALVDGTYSDNKMSKVIAHDYKPSTNQ